MAQKDTETKGAELAKAGPILSSADAKALAKSTPQRDGLGNFALYIKHNMASLKGVAARHLDPQRVLKIIVACVSRTPALQKCSMESILRSTLQAAELGLEPGSALGAAYLVPYGEQCTLIVGYRGLIDLAFRSGKVKSVRSQVVYQGDKFEYEDGLSIVLRHIPDHSATRDPKQITYAYCVVHLKDGGVLCDVMTRGEVDAIRGRSKASGSGPWVSDYAEMAKKTVTRRCLKYAPMSVEMSKALASDEAAESGDLSVLAEFETLDVEPEPAGASKTERTRDKIAADPDTGEVLQGALA